MDTTLAMFIHLPKGRPLHSPFGLRHLRTTVLRRQRSAEKSAFKILNTPI
jgi:hypothetical protein